MHAYKQRIQSAHNSTKRRKYLEWSETRADLFDAHESMVLQAHSAGEILHNLSFKLEDVVMECKYYSINLRSLHSSKSEPGTTPPTPQPQSCDSMVKVLESIYEGRKCFTFFSELHGELKDIKEDESQNVKNGAENDDGFDKRQLHQTSRAFAASYNTNMLFDRSPSIELILKPMDAEADIIDSYVDRTQIAVEGKSGKLLVKNCS